MSKQVDLKKVIMDWQLERFKELDPRVVHQLPTGDTFLRYITADGKPRLGGVLQYVDPKKRYIYLKNLINGKSWSVALVKGNRYFTNSKMTRDGNEPPKKEELVEEEPEEPKPTPIAEKKPDKPKKKEPTAEQKAAREKELKRLDSFLKHLYYDQGYKWGAQKLYAYAKSAAPEGLKVLQADVREWVRRQPSAQLTKPKTNAATVHDVRPIVSKAPLNLVCLDIKEMPNISKHHYILFIVDVYSRFLWGETLPSRDSKYIFRAVDKILARMPHKPKAILSDNEFKNAFAEHIKKAGIGKHLTTQPHTPQSNAIVERVNGTFGLYYERSKIDEPKEARFWYRLVPKFIEHYNNSPHSAFGNKKTPAEMLSDEPEDTASAHEQDVKIRTANKNLDEPTIEAGDIVRLPLTKQKIEKKSRQTYSKETYVVDRVIPPNKSKGLPARVKLRQGSDGSEVQGEVKVNSVQLVKTGPFHKS